MRMSRTVRRTIAGVATVVGTIVVTQGGPSIIASNILFF